MFGGGGGSPPPPPPPPPTSEDPAVQQARAQAMQMARLRRGRASTVLAGGLGDVSGSATPTATTLGGDRR